MLKQWQVGMLIAGCAMAMAGTAAFAQRAKDGSILSRLGPSFRAGTADVTGAEIAYVVGGEGPPVILIHGFPQDWTEFHAIMPQLAKRFTVLAVDLRGVGGSTATDADFDAKTLATDVHQVATKLGLKQPYIVGHDIGGQVAYAYALQYGRDVRGAIIAETALLGMKGTDALDASPALWHVRFMQVPGVSEKLIAGRHDVFLGSFLDYGKFSPEERNLSLAAYERDDQMQAMLTIYRAFPKNAQFNSSHRASADIPIVFVTGDKSPFEQIRTATVEGIKAAGFARARAVTISGSMHYLFADVPDKMVTLIENEAD